MRRKVILVVNICPSLFSSISNELADTYQLVFIEKHNSDQLRKMKEKVFLILLSPTFRLNMSEDMIRKIKERFSQIPVLCLGKALPASRTIELFRIGITDFVLTPFQRGSLYERVAHILAPPKLNLKGLDFSRLIRSNTQKLTIGEFWEGYDSILSSSKTKAHHTVLTHNGSALGLSNALEEPKVEKEIVVRFLGNFCVHVKGKQIGKLPKKTKLLLAYLLFRAPKKLPKDHLMEVFWPDSKPDSARASLNAAIYKIRHAFPKLEESFISHADDCYFINPNIDIETDVARFLMYWRSARITEGNRGLGYALDLYKKAIQLYKGAFVAEFPFETWISAQKEELQSKYEKILEKLITYYRGIGDYDQTILMGDRLLREDPCIEEIHYILMETYLEIGRRDRALKQYQKCEKALQHAWDCAPSTKVMELYQRIQENCD